MEKETWTNELNIQAIPRPIIITFNENKDGSIIYMSMKEQQNNLDYF
jgi:hypothetical protein